MVSKLILIDDIKWRPMNKENAINLISKLLGIAGDKFSNHGCNDLGEDFWKGISTEEKLSLYKEYHEWNGDPEEYNPECIGYLGDSALMHYFSESMGKIL